MQNFSKKCGIFFRTYFSDRFTFYIILPFNFSSEVKRIDLDHCRMKGLSGGQVLKWHDLFMEQH